MRNCLPLVVLALALGACNPAPSHEGMEMSAVAPAVVKAGTGTGVVKSVDTKAGTITLDHAPVESVGWPAMTMTFPVASPALLDNIAAGQTVSFDVTVTDNKPLITALRK